MKNILTLAAVFFLTTSIVLAQVTSDGFGIQVLVSGPPDDEAPTTPTLQSVTPITDAQIDVSWSASTDNAIVSGYSVFRDGVPIATTSLLSYADTGLAASTTYAYAVRAFDPSFNYSSTSNSLATTTLQPPEPPIPPVDTSSSSVGATAARVTLDDFQQVLGISTTTFFITTVHHARLEVRWGRTDSYELGYVVSNIYTKEHVIPIADLEPGTTYSYEIVGYTPRGFPTVLTQGEFTTQAGIEIAIPQNVNQFQARSVGDSVVLDWQLPSIPIEQVRIVRSHFGFPQHPQDGAVVYQGLGSATRDEGILAEYSPVYYTAFVYDSAGSVSSGAVAVVYRSSGRENTDLLTKPVVENIVSIEKATSTIQQERVTIDMKLPTLTDIRLQQGGVLMRGDEMDITLDSTDSFLISIPRAAVSGNLKSIIASVGVRNSSQGFSAFLLRINKDKTAYEALVAPLQVTGETIVTVEVYDYEAYVVGTYSIPVNFIAATIENGPVLFPDLFFQYGVYGLLFLLVVFGLWWWLVLYMRRAEDNKNEVTVK